MSGCPSNHGRQLHTALELHDVPTSGSSGIHRARLLQMAGSLCLKPSLRWNMSHEALNCRGWQCQLRGTCVSFHLWGAQWQLTDRYKKLRGSGREPPRCIHFTVGFVLTVTSFKASQSTFTFTWEKESYVGWKTGSCGLRRLSPWFDLFSQDKIWNRKIFIKAIAINK